MVTTPSLALVNFHMRVVGIVQLNGRVHGLQISGLQKLPIRVESGEERADLYAEIPSF